MKKTPIFIAALVLGGFAVTGVTLVAVTHHAMDKRIMENTRLAMMRKLQSIIPEGQYTNDPLEDRILVHAPERLGTPETRIYRARKDGAPLAVILTPVVPDGYSGPIELLVSVLADGTLGGVRVLTHHETPGLGDKIEELKSDWIMAFNGKSLKDPGEDDWGVKRDGGEFDQFTGATITPRAVVAAVKNTLQYVQSQGDLLYTEPSVTAAPPKGES